MALDVSGLTDYVKENQDALIGKVVAGAKSVRILAMQTGIKTKERLHFIDTEVALQADSGCGRTPSDTTTLSEREIEVAPIKTNEDICLKELEKKYTQIQLKAGSKQEEIPFEEEYFNQKAMTIAYENEKAIWQGDKSSAVANLKNFDGFLKVIDAATGVIDGNTSSATSITSANIVKLIDDMTLAIPAKLLTENKGRPVAILMGTEIFRMYTLALRNANLYHYDGKGTEDMEIMVPGSNVKAIALEGLSGTNRMVAGTIGSEGNFVVGTDLENEEEDFDSWYSKDDKVVKVDTAYKLGVQVKEPTEIIEFTLSA